MKVTKMISRKMAGGILLGFLAVAGIVTGSQGSVTVYAAEELQGSGTAEDPYVITGSEDLWKFAEIVKASSDRNECAKVADGVTEIDTTCLLYTSKIPHAVFAATAWGIFILRRGFCHIDDRNPAVKYLTASLLCTQKY